MSECAVRRLVITSIVVAVGVFSEIIRAQTPSFEQAYERELNELRATRAALQSSIDRFETRLAHQKAQFSGEIEQSTSRLLALRNRARELDAKRDQLAQKHLVAEDHGAVLGALLSDATASQASPSTGALRSVDGDATAFMAAVDKAAGEIDASSRIRVAEGHFFDIDGKQVTGQIVHIGDIAALGSSPATGGVLLKLQDEYRILDDGPRDQAKRIVAGDTPDAVDVFLFSPECTGHDPTRGNGVVGMLDKGGPVAWVIMGLALLGLLLIIERLWTLSRLTNWRAGSFDAMAAKLRDDDFEAVTAMTVHMGAVGKVLRDIVEQRTLPREDLEKRVTEIILKAMPALERSLTVLVVITAVAPLLGLLGTVTGMISTFNVITEFGTGDPKLLSGGISEALITTKLGLAVAVPFLLVRSLIARWSDRIIENMQTYSLAAVNIVFGRKAPSNE